MSKKITPIIKIRPLTSLEVEVRSYLGLEGIKCISYVAEDGLCNYRWIADEYDSTCLSCLQCRRDYWFITDSLTSNYHQSQ